MGIQSKFNKPASYQCLEFCDSDPFNNALQFLGEEEQYIEFDDCLSFQDQYKDDDVANLSFNFQELLMQRESTLVELCRNEKIKPTYTLAAKSENKVAFKTSINQYKSDSHTTIDSLHLSEVGFCDQLTCSKGDVAIPNIAYDDADNGHLKESFQDPLVEKMDTITATSFLKKENTEKNISFALPDLSQEKIVYPNLMEPSDYIFQMNAHKDNDSVAGSSGSLVCGSESQSSSENPIITPATLTEKTASPPSSDVQLVTVSTSDPAVELSPLVAVNEHLTPLQREIMYVKHEDCLTIRTGLQPREGHFNGDSPMQMSPTMVDRMSTVFISSQLMCASELETEIKSYSSMDVCQVDYSFLGSRSIYQPDVLICHDYAVLLFSLRNDDVETIRLRILITSLKCATCYVIVIPDGADLNGIATASVLWNTLNSLVTYFEKKSAQAHEVRFSLKIRLASGWEHAVAVIVDIAKDNYSEDFATSCLPSESTVDSKVLLHFPFFNIASAHLITKQINPCDLITLPVETVMGMLQPETPSDYILAFRTFLSDYSGDETQELDWPVVGDSFGKLKPPKCVPDAYDHFTRIPPAI